MGLKWVILFYFLFFVSSPEDTLTDFRERGRKGGREKEERERDID